jgi:signal transduction histidine kinase
MRRKDGSTFIAFISSTVMEINGVRCNLSLARDITDRIRVEDALRESNQRLALATTSGKLGVWDRDLLDGSEIWNDRMFELYGLEPRPCPPDYVFWLSHILHPDDRQAADAAIQAALAGRQPYELAFRAVHPDGSIHHIQSNAHIQRDTGGRAVRIIGINRDRTQEVEAEAEQRRLEAEMIHAENLESLGSLAGGVAHDMNNVLAAIMGMASVLRTTCTDDDPRVEQLDTITRACTRGRDVVKSLLYFAHKGMEAMGPVNLNIIALEVVQLLSHTTLKRYQITKDLQEPLGLIDGDAGALNHALINLCVNAVDAMPAGGALTIRTRQSTERGIEISIKDTGEGMSPEVLKKCVEPFFSTKPPGKGTGLGLAMVYGTMKAHKGTFEIRSEEGLGTEVILGFPPLPEPPAERGDQAKDLLPRSSARGPFRILIVDDDELIRVSVGPMLTALGHDVRAVESGQEAIELFCNGLDFDLVILDMKMPGLNGAETLTRLLAIRPAQVVLMATGYSDDAVALLLENRPNVSSIEKPFSLEELRNKIETIDRLGRGQTPPTC